MNKIEKIALAALGIGGAYLLYKKVFHRMISNSGLEFLENLEGFKTKAYKDVRGLMTIGVGHLILPAESYLLKAVLTNDQVKQLLDKDLDIYEKAVTDTIKVPLTKYQKDALVSFAFNVGVNGFKNSSLAKAINAKKHSSEIIKGFSQYRRPDVLKERRAKEARLFLTGNYSTILPEADFQKYFSI